MLVFCCFFFCRVGLTHSVGSPSFLLEHVSLVLCRGYGRPGGEERVVPTHPWGLTRVRPVLECEGEGTCERRRDSEMDP